MDQAVQESAGGQHHGTRQKISSPSPVTTPDNAAVLQNQVFGRRFADFQIGDVCADALCIAAR